MRRQTNVISSIDWITVGLYVALVLMGWFNIYAAVFDEQNTSIFSASQRYGKQLLWIITAVSLAVFVCLLDIRFYSSFAYLIYAVCILVLVTVLVVGKEVNGSKSWFVIGPVQLQPSEFAKIATSLALAKYLGNYSGKMMRFWNIVRIGIVIFLPPILIILQPDTGSCLVYLAFLIVLYREGLSQEILLFGILAVTLFILSLLMQDAQAYLTGGLIALGFVFFGIKSRDAKGFFKGTGLFLVVFGILYGINMAMGERFEPSELLFVTAMAIAAVFMTISALRKTPLIRRIIFFILCALIFTFSVDFVFDNVLGGHQQKRILVMLGMESDPLGLEYNVNQSKIAIGSGGFWGKGFLQGTQTKYNFVPEQSTDFIFCTVGEEWGFAGAAVVVVLFMALLLRLLYIAERQRSVFSRVYSYCVVSVLFLHCTINIGMTIDLMPVIGIPLPFFSYGGSSLWAFTILLFIMLRLDASRGEYIR
ncbi:MAG: rod shape-determining protein RodA [Bacteroidales bacterium]|jgi:rod shape determining protein RodA|nr:rod shape-determining protein RodA [Bacteroidales bacterium]